MVKIPPSLRPSILACLLSALGAVGCGNEVGYSNEDDMGRPPGSIDIPNARSGGRPSAEVSPQDQARVEGPKGEKQQDQAQAQAKSAEAPPQAP